MTLIEQIQMIEQVLITVQIIEIQNKKVIYKIIYQLMLQAIKMIIKVDQILTVKLAMIIKI